jgi:hypothetical protein
MSNAVEEGTRMQIRVARAVVAAGAIALLALAPGAQSATPTWEQGPKGGDTYNVVNQTDPAVGRVTIGRVGLTPGVIGCPGLGGYNSLQTTVPVTAATKQVTISFIETATSGYTFITGVVRPAGGDILGSKYLYGPITNTGSMTIPFTVPVDKDGNPTITSVQVVAGLAVSSACPNVDGGTVRFTDLAVS